MTKTEAKDLLDNYLISKGELSADDRIKEINAWVNLPRRKPMFDDGIDPILESIDVPTDIECDDPQFYTCRACGSHEVINKNGTIQCMDCGHMEEDDEPKRGIVITKDTILPRRFSNGKNCPYCGSHRITLEDEMYDCHECGEVSESD